MFSAVQDTVRSSKVLYAAFKGAGRSPAIPPHNFFEIMRSIISKKLLIAKMQANPGNIC